MADKKKKANWRAVHCPIHGTGGVGDPNIKPHVRVSAKGTRAEKQGKLGCPMCPKK